MSMIDKDHDGVAVTQSSLPNKLWRLTLSWSLPQPCGGSGIPDIVSLACFWRRPLYNAWFAWILQTTLCCKSKVSVSETGHLGCNLIVIFRQPSLLQIPQVPGKSPSPLVHIHVDNGICKSRYQAVTHANCLQGALSKHCFMCCIPKPIHWLSTPRPGRSWTGSSSLSYVAGVLKFSASTNQSTSRVRALSFSPVPHWRLVVSLFHLPPWPPRFLSPPYCGMHLRHLENLLHAQVCGHHPLTFWFKPEVMLWGSDSRS